MSYPKITVITPSYNQGQFLEETILSVVNQNYPNLEFIIVDGGSSDNSVDIIKKYEYHITYWISEKDKGTYDANNKALQLMTGDYWCVVNSDDKLQPGALLTIANLIKNRPYDWISGGVTYIDENSNVLSTKFPETPNRTAGFTFLTSCWIYHPSTFLSKKLFEEVGLFAKTDVMDYEYWIRSEMKGYTPFIINEVLGQLRYHLNCKSMDYPKILNQEIKIFKQIEDSFKGKEKDEVRNHILALSLGIYQYEIKSSLFNKKYLKASQLLLITLFKFPSQLFKRWPLGILRRYFVGIREEEFSPQAFATAKTK